MIKIGIIGDVGSGKSYVAKNFKFPFFNADEAVLKIYKKNINCFKKLKKKFPKLISKFPIDKKELTKILLDNKKNIKKLGKIVHPYVRKELLKFLNKNKNKKFVILDIPLLLENKIKKKKLILIFVDSSQKEINLRLKKRKSFNSKIYKIIKKNQINPQTKKNLSNYIIKNNFKKNSVLKQIKNIKLKLTSDRNRLRY